MKPIIYILCSVFFWLNLNCKNKEQTAVSGLLTDIQPPILTKFKIAVNPLDPQPLLPGIQSGVNAYSNSKLLLFAGRTNGFHGLISSDTSFNAKQNNQNIYVVDLYSWKYSSVPLPAGEDMLPFTGTNIQYFQDGDTLYLIGGYGRKSTTDYQNNYTLDKCIAISVSAMIRAVESNSDIRKAILYTIQSPFFKVTGGEVFKLNGWFYLMYGQVYDQPYSVGVSGKYTESVRIFRIKNGKLTDTSSVQDPLFHRRDLNVVKVKQNSGDFFATYGGVFNENNKGFVHPIYIYPDNGKITYKQDTLSQISNQYDCAKLNVFDPVSNTHVTALLGGIGASFFNFETKSWDPNGDDGNPLPFVKAITQMICKNGSISQYIQNPLTDPELPEFIGADALFIPIYAIRFEDQVIDATKLTRDSMTIGYFYGGIQSPRPTSSDIYPTTVNSTLYSVHLIRK